MAVQYLGLLLLVLSAWLTQYPTSGKLQPTQDCTTAWECCIYEFLSDEFNPCCNDHGCCPLCDKYWPEGCCFNNETYKFGSIVIEHPENCIKFLCTAEPLLQIPFIKATVHPVFYNSGTANTYCSGNLNLNCVDKFGILRPEGSEWFVSATCELCQCIKGKIECRPVKRPCPPPPNPVCVPKPGGCCPQWDCGSLPKNGAGCIANDGTYFSYGQAWWDSQNPCVYNKCTENGILQFKKDCSKLLPPSNPSCRLIKPENECCEKWQCDLQCPDPSSYGRVCFHYFDQCKSDLDCKTGESCCLVAGCGQECIRLCKDSLGNFHTIGEVWLEPYTQENFTCTEEGSKPVNKNGVQTPPPIPKEPEIYPHRPTLADCLSTGLNLTKLAQDLQILSNLTDVFPLKDPNQYLSEYLEIFRQDDGLLTPDETRRVQTLAERFNWSSVFSLLNVDTKEQQLAALSAGDASLQIKNVVSEAIAQRNDTLLSDSPSVKHQVAFRRTDPISTQMAQLGVVIEEATLKLVLSFDIPVIATPALPILGEAIDCTKRFKSFLRPSLSPTCDPASPFRTFDGTCNNLNNNFWGAAFTKFRRILSPAYGDGISTLRRASDSGELPSARLISTTVNAETNVESPNLSFLHVTFAQFIDHDITATPIAKGYLGSTVKCCDDLKVKLDLAFHTLNETKKVIQDLRLTEPSLITSKTLGEIEITISSLNSLKVSGEAFFTVSSIGKARRAIHELQVASKFRLPLRPQSAECAPISIPPNDPFYSCYGKTCMEFVRSAPAPSCKYGPREQLNQHTAYIDGSVIYGVKQETVETLRTFTDGLLKHQVTHEDEEMLPAEEDIGDGCNIPEKYDDGIFCFKAGDGRVNEQVLLTLMQTVWAREHNRVARTLKSYNNDGWDDERLFQEARRIVVAELQHVTFNEFLPPVLGSLLMNILQLKPKIGDVYTVDYDEFLDASIANSFATAAYRFGHSQITDFIQRVNKHGLLHTNDLSDLFFKPFSLYDKEAMEDYTRGSTSHPAKKVDAYFTDEVAGKLFRGNLPFGLDLFALNIQRGRDHGLPSYTEFKAVCGAPVNSFSDLTSVMDDNIVDRLEEVYEKVEDIDLFVGGIAENPFLDGILGPTFTCIIADQFLRLKRGDRFWYEYKNGPGAFTTAQLIQLRRVTLARILCNNLPELIRIQPEPLKNLGLTNPRVDCSSPLIPHYTLLPWKL